MQLSGEFTAANLIQLLASALATEKEATSLTKPPKLTAKQCGVFHQQRSSEAIEKLSPALPEDKVEGTPLPGDDTKNTKEIPKNIDEL